MNKERRTQATSRNRQYTMSQLMPAAENKRTRIHNENTHSKDLRVQNLQAIGTTEMVKKSESTL